MIKNLRIFVIFLCVPALISSWVYAEEISEPTLYLEFFWLQDSVPCEALLISPPQKIPLVIMRVYSKEQKLISLVAACGMLTRSLESEEELLLTCSEPRVIWGKTGTEKSIPDHFLITGKEYGAVTKGEEIEACLVKPVPGEKEEEIVKKYLPPEESK